MTKERIVTGWAFPERTTRVPLFGFLSWKNAEGWGREFNEVLIRRCRRVIGFEGSYSFGVLSGWFAYMDSDAVRKWIESRGER